MSTDVYVNDVVPLFVLMSWKGIVMNNCYQDPNQNKMKQQSYLEKISEQRKKRQEEEFLRLKAEEERKLKE